MRVYTLNFSVVKINGFQRSGVDLLHAVSNIHPLSHKFHEDMPLVVEGIVGIRHFGTSDYNFLRLVRWLVQQMVAVCITLKFPIK